jgi:hypothetical protein
LGRCAGFPSDHALSLRFRDGFTFQFGFKLKRSGSSAPSNSVGSGVLIHGHYGKMTLVHFGSSDLIQFDVSRFFFIVLPVL